MAEKAVLDVTDGICDRDILVKAMDAAGYFYDEINSGSDLCFNYEGGSTRFDDWKDVQEWLQGVVFDDPAISDEVEAILKGEEMKQGIDIDAGYLEASLSVMDALMKMTNADISVIDAYMNIQQYIDGNFPKGLFSVSMLPAGISQDDGAVEKNGISVELLNGYYEKLKADVADIAKAAVENKKNEVEKDVSPENEKSEDRKTPKKKVFGIDI